MHLVHAREQLQVKNDQQLGKNKNLLLLTQSCVPDSLALHIHTFHKDYYPLSSLQYFFGCFSFVFLESYSSASSSEKILTASLYLALTIQGFSMSTISVVSLAKTFSQSFFKYSSHFLFFFSICFLFLAFSYALVLATFLVFCAAQSIW